jgi:dipeptide transport system substrate-binding protein
MRQIDKNHPFYKVSGGTYEYSDGMEMPTLIKEIVKIDDHTVKFVLTRPEAPMLANLAMDFASIQSKEYADKMMAATPEVIDQGGRHWALQVVAYQKDAVIRYKVTRLLDGQGADRRPGLRRHPDASVRCQKLKAGECHVMAMPNPADLAAMARTRYQSHAAGRAQRRLPRLQHPGEAVRRRPRPQGAQHGDQQAGDHRRGLPDAGR